MIKLNNISKNFGKFLALNDINLTFGNGQCIGLIGPNGSGKTTLIKSILGMVVPEKGEILFNGKTIKNDFAYRAQIGYMPQIGRYPDNMTIGQIFEMMKDIRKSDNTHLDEELIVRFELDKIFDKRMRTLSGGTRQKVSAALAFLFDANVLILDEPTAGLDPLSADILKEKIIKENKKDKLVIITSHILSELDELISDLIYMQDGKIRFYKNIEEVKNESGHAKLSKAISTIMYEAI